MSVVAEIGREVERVAVDVCWRQWSTVRNRGLPIGEVRSRSIIDPEALLLLSLYVQDQERRLTQDLEWFAAIGSSLLSVQRTRTLMGELPAEVGEQVSWFADQCVRAGDRRWKSLASVVPEQAEADEQGSPFVQKEHEPLQLLSAATLMFRFRAGFGVGAKADLLAFLVGMAQLLGEGRTHATAEVIAKGISYSAVSVRRAATDMTLARFVDASRDRPVNYEVDASDWSGLVGDDVPPWRFWSQMFALLANTSSWARTQAESSAVVQASRARDLFEQHEQPLRWNRVAVPDPEGHPGAAFLEVFHSTVHAACRFIETES